jgi:VCBS repeat-containing protein
MPNLRYHNNDSNVSFDVDNDGKVERTGWVDGNDAILVHDKNGDGTINDITETISEYYQLDNLFDGDINASWTADAEGKYSNDGLDALSKLDSNQDGIFDNQDAMWDDLRIWQDADEDGVTDENELISLDDAGIQEFDLSNIQTIDKERNEGNVILSRSTYTTTDGRSKEVAAVDFTTNPIGYEFNDVNLGKLATAEEGTKSLVLSNQEGENIDLSNWDGQEDEKPNNVFGNVGNDTIIGDEGNNWISGGQGSDTINGGAGDDILIIDEQDLNENIDGGEGRDVVIVNSDQGVSFNLTQSNVETFIGGNGDDVIIGGGTANVFVDGGSGDDVIIGGAADDALSGSDGNDMIGGGYGNDIIRGHRGGDILTGDEGDDYLEGGLGDDVINGGVGNDIIMEGSGNDEIDGGLGYDLVKYNGSYKDYKIGRDGADYIIENLKTGEIDKAKNIEGVRFNDVTVKLAEGNISPLPVTDFIEIANKKDAVTISAAELLANDVDIDADAVEIMSIHNVVGGSAQTITDGNGKITAIEFTPNESFIGNMSFDYAIRDSEGSYSIISQTDSDGNVTSAPMRAQVNFRLESDPTDPLYSNQWYLSEINVQKVWEEYTGAGVKIGVFEEGDFNATHQDLDDNTLESHKNDQEFRQVDNYAQHKTTVAGVIAAERNDYGIVGVAYNAMLDGYSWEPDETGLQNLTKVDIANNSWSATLEFSDNFSDPYNPYFIYQELIEDSVQQGRSGLGTINVFSGGNSRQEGDNVNYHNIQNSRFVTTVGSINQAGNLSTLTEATTPFSNPGAAILVSAPGSNIETTGNLLINDNGSEFLGEFSSSQGTSFSAPIVSGVVALMLEANPNLGYRDVQKILAMSARKFNDPSTSWQENGATNWNGGSMHYSQDYGYGIVDAFAAVRLAETWTDISTYYNEASHQIIDNGGIEIADNATTEKQLNIADSNMHNIENVEVKVDLTHLSLSDLTIRLISPNGTSSILMDQPTNSAYSGGLNFNFSSRAFLGESVDGTWKLQITDSVTGEVGYLNSWELKFYGKLDDGTNDIYVFTNEFAGFNSSDRSVLSDNDGGEDVINTAAVNSDSYINLNSGQTSQIAGKNVSVSGIDTNSAEYQQLLSSIPNLELSLASKQNEVNSKQQQLDIKQAEFNNIDANQNVKYEEYLVKLSARDAAINLVNQRGQWFNDHEYQATFNTTHVFRNIHTGQNIAITVSAYNAKVSEYNTAFASYEQKQAELATVVDEYNYFNTRRSELPGEINDLNSQISQLNDQKDQIESELSFAQEYTQAVENGEISSIENVVTGDGDDVIIGDSLNNKIYAGRGENTLTGNGGEDHFIIKKHPGNVDIITDFEIGVDKINVSDFGDDVADQINIIQDGLDTVIEFGDNQIVRLQGIDSADLSLDNLVSDYISFLGNDGGEVNGSNADEQFFGSEGDDIINGLGGNDIIYGNEGAESLNGGAGDDQLFGGAGNDVIIGGAGNDEIHDGEGKDIVYAGDGDDVIHLEGGNATTSFSFPLVVDTGFYGEGGNDTFVIHKDTSGSEGSGILNDVIVDFEINNPNEKIDLTVFTNVTDVSDLRFTNMSLNGAQFLRVYVAGEQSNQYITLQGITEEQLSNSNFTFYENQDPVANDDELTINEDNSVIISIADLIANDSDFEDGSVIFDQIIANPTNGSLVDNGDGTLTYTPNANFNGEDNFTYQIADSHGAIKQANIKINITPENDTPIIVNSIDDVLVDEDATSTVITAATIAAAFADIDTVTNADNLTYSASLSNGNQLPSWLAIDSNTGEITSNNPDNDDVGSYGIIITATDNSGSSVSQSFAINVDNVNDAPIVSAINGIDILEDENSNNIFSFIGNDVDAGDLATLTYNIENQPSKGLVVNNNDGTFSFNASGEFDNLKAGEVQDITFTYTATDSSGATSNSEIVTIQITGTNDAPIVTVQTADQTATQDQSFTLAIPQNTFSDIDNDALTISATLMDGSDLPDWLSFNPTTKSFTGTPANGDVGILAIKLTASDGEFSASETC